MATRKLATRTFDFTAVPGGPHGEFPRQLIETLDSMERQAEELQEQISGASDEPPDLRLTRVKSVQETADPFEISADPAVHRPGTLFDDVSASGAGSIQLPALEDIRQHYDLDTEIPHFWFLNTAAQALSILAGTDTTIEVGASAGDVASFPITRDNEALHLALIDDRWRALNPKVRRGAMVVRTAAQSVTSGAETYVAWTSEIFDTHGYHDNVTNPERLTVPAGHAGIHAINAAIEIAASAGGTIRVISVNHYSAADVLLRQAALQQVPTGGGASNYLCTSARWLLAAGEYVKIQAHQDSGGALNLGSSAGGLLNTWATIERTS